MAELVISATGGSTPAVFIAVNGVQDSQVAGVPFTPASGILEVLEHSHLADDLGYAPTNLTAPAITGTATVGETLTASDGTWEHTPTSYAYQWYDDDVAISGATEDTYELQAAEEGGVITVGVTPTNEYGVGDEEVSDGTAAVAGA